ncbi:MAG: GIY-YIG nuclease family protein [Bacteroidota bacterium]|uniref:GIY-YIG nuclease family protein n=1 Tax=Flagellimonas profundi TaxID=2915620 RepID=A0ABS3FKT3_9FLAO|nr:GIY-YIG nuclease family protein [Allomuricauda profundi]MBO0343576.1 GIY-YIG nuclease family protein [Allomuricauda profundi]MEC7771667.1 GIY-YIG nuclease family protein [Bacteroidota bacterium]
MKTRKELKDQYKQMKFPMGVFQIKNISNNRVFIDNSLDMESKWNRHKMELKFGNHRNKDLQTDWNMYGEENFTFEVLSELKIEEGVKINCNSELNTLQDIVVLELDKRNLY